MIVPPSPQVPRLTLGMTRRATTRQSDNPTTRQPVYRWSLATKSIEERAKTGVGPERCEVRVLLEEANIAKAMIGRLLQRLERTVVVARQRETAGDVVQEHRFASRRRSGAPHEFEPASLVAELNPGVALHDHRFCVIRSET